MTPAASELRLGGGPTTMALPAAAASFGRRRPLLRAVAVVASIAGRSCGAGLPPAYDEAVAVAAMREGIASYAGFNTDARFSAVSALNCSADRCSLPSTLNVSFLQRRRDPSRDDGGVVAAAMVARDSKDGSVVVAFAGAGMDGQGMLHYMGLAEQEFASYRASTCPGPVQVNKLALEFYMGLREEMLSLLRTYTMASSGARNVTVRVSGYSLGTTLGAIAALDIRAMITNGSLPSYVHAIHRRAPHLAAPCVT